MKLHYTRKFVKTSEWLKVTLFSAEWVLHTFHSSLCWTLFYPLWTFPVE